MDKTENFYSLCNDYQSELQKAASLRFARIEEKYSNRTNKIQSPKYTELTKEFQKCTTRKNKLLNYLYDNISSLNGDNDSDYQKKTSDNFSSCRSFSKTASDLACAINEEHFVPEEEINEDETIPVSEIDTWYQHARNHEMKNTPKKLLEFKEIGIEKRLKYNGSKHDTFNSRTEFVHSKKKSVKLGKVHSLACSEKSSVEYCQEDSYDNFSINKASMSKNSKLIDCSQESSRIYEKNYLNENYKAKLRNRRNTNKSECLSIRRSSRIQENVKKNNTFIEPRTDEVYEAEMEIEPLLKSALYADQNHKRSKRLQQPDLSINDLDSQSEKIQTIMSEDKNETLIIHGNSNKNNNVYKDFGSNMAVALPLMNSRCSSMEDQILVEESIINNSKSVVRKNPDRSPPKIVKKRKEQIQQHSDLISCNLNSESENIEAIVIRECVVNNMATALPLVESEFSSIKNQPLTEECKMKNFRSCREKDICLLKRSKDIRKTKSKNSSFIKEISNNVATTSKYLLLKKDWNVYISSVKRKNSEILYILPLKTDKNRCSCHKANAEQIGILDKQSEICFTTSSSPPIIQVPSKDQDFGRTEDTDGEIAAVERLSLLTPVSSDNEQDGSFIKFSQPDVRNSKSVSSVTKKADSSIFSKQGKEDHISSSQLATDIESIVDTSGLYSLLTTDENKTNSSSIFHSPFKRKKLRNMKELPKIKTLCTSKLPTVIEEENENEIEQEVESYESKRRTSATPHTNILRLKNNFQNLDSVSQSKNLTNKTNDLFTKPSDMPIHKSKDTINKSKLNIVNDENLNETYSRYQRSKIFPEENLFESPKKILKVFKRSRNGTIILNRNLTLASNQCSTKKHFQGNEDHICSSQLATDNESTVDTSGLYSLLTTDGNKTNLSSTLDGSFSLFNKTLRNMKENILKEESRTKRKNFEDDLLLYDSNRSCVSFLKNSIVNESISYKSMRRDNTFQNSSISNRSFKPSLTPSLWLKSMLSSSKYRE